MGHGESKIDTKTARLYDKRTVERSIKKGLVARKDYDKYLKSLDDVTDKGVFGTPENDGPGDDESSGADSGADSGNPS
jgi:hypothetical protein